MGLGNKAANIPVVTSQAQLEQMLATWRNTLNRIVKAALPAPQPQNFAVTQARGGLSLSWSKVDTFGVVNHGTIGTTGSGGASDGYELLISKNGSFVDDVTSVKIRDVNQINYFHPVSGGPARYFFKIHTTSGTTHDPQSIHGPYSGTISHVSLDSTDTTTKATTKRDNYTTDQNRANARFGRYVNYANVPR